MAHAAPPLCWWRAAVAPLPRRAARRAASTAGWTRSKIPDDASSSSPRPGAPSALRAGRRVLARAATASDDPEPRDAPRTSPDASADARPPPPSPPRPPAPVRVRRPRSGKQRAKDGVPVRAPDADATSLRASRQHDALFKGLTRQLASLSALGLAGSGALDRWRADVAAAHGDDDVRAARARIPGARPTTPSHPTSESEKTSRSRRRTDDETDGSKPPRVGHRIKRCGVCGESGHNARTCVLARRRGADLVSYYEDKYGDGEGTVRDAAGKPKMSKTSKNTSESSARRKRRVERAYRCSVCGEIGHNAARHREKPPAASAASTRPDSRALWSTCTCSSCGEMGHNSRTCPIKLRRTDGGGSPGGASDVRGESTRDKRLERKAAELCLLSRARSERTGESPLSLAEACEAVGIDTRYKQNVHNVTVALRRDGAAKGTSFDWVADQDWNWDADGDEDQRGVARGIPLTAPPATMTREEEREALVAAASDVLADPELSPAEAAMRRGLRRTKANLVANVRRGMEARRENCDSSARE